MRNETRYIVLHRAEVDFPQYHAVVMRDGTVQQMMSWDAHGAAVRNFNSIAISVALEGDFCTADAAQAAHGTPTAEQWVAAVQLVAKLSQTYPLASIVGHTELGPGATMYVEKLTAPSSCPGTRFDMKQFIADVRAHYPSAQC